MADNVRKSSRASKPKKTFEAASTPIAKARGKGKKGTKQASSEPPPEDEEGDAIIRCICGYVEEDEDDERKMIVCDNCEAWQHNECMEMSLDDNELPDQYFCEQCRPDLHRDLLEKIERGERPWEERAKHRQQEEEERKRKKKGGKRGRKSGRPSDFKPEPAPVPAPEPKVEPEPQPEAQPPASNGVPDVVPKTTLPAEEAKPEQRPETIQKRKLPEETIEESKTPSHQEHQSKIRKVSASAEPKPPVPAPRRKSSAAVAPTTTPGKNDLAKRIRRPADVPIVLVENISELRHETRRRAADALMKGFADWSRQAQKEGSLALPPNQSIEAFATKLALQVEYAMSMNLWGNGPEPAEAYRAMFRMSIHNLKQNPALRLRLITGDLSPNDFSKMSSHDMASKDLQEKTAEMKRAADKQAVLVEQQGPRIRRTHKGEEFVEGPESQGPTAPDNAFSAPVRRPRPSLESDIPRQASPEAASPRSPNAVELSEDVGPAVASPTNAQSLSVDTKAPPRPGAGPERQSSSNFNIQDVWSSVTGPDGEAHKPRPSLPRTESEAVAPPPAIPVDSGDADIDRLLKDEDQEEEEPYSPTEYPADPNAPVWHGKLAMPGVAEFKGEGKHVAGANLNATFPWAQMMAETLNIEGRIDIERASEYLCGLRFSQTTDVSVVAITPAEDENGKAAFNKLFQYFVDRKRYGVVGKSIMKEVKDTYLVPLDAGATAKPEFIELLEHCTIQTPVPERMLLITFVIRLHNSPTGQENTPRQLDAAAVASPVNQAGAFQAPTPFPAPTPAGYPAPQTPTGSYRGSPPQPQGGFQGQPQYGNSPPQPRQPYNMPPHQMYQQPFNGPVGMEAARQALGDMAFAPTVATLIQEAPRVGVNEFETVKELFETVPATRNDFGMLRSMLTMKLQGGVPGS